MPPAEQAALYHREQAFTGAHQLMNELLYKLPLASRCFSQNSAISSRRRLLMQGMAFHKQQSATTSKSISRQSCESEPEFQYYETPAEAKGTPLEGVSHSCYLGHDCVNHAMLTC